MRNLTLMLLAVLLALPATVPAAEATQSNEDLRKEIEKLTDEIDYLHERIDKNFDDFGAKAMSGAFGDPMNPDSPLGRLLAAQPDLAAAFQQGQLQGVGPFVFAPKRTYDLNNDIIYPTRLRLDM